MGLLVLFLLNLVLGSLVIVLVSIFLFAIVFVSIWVEEWDRIFSYITRAGTIALILNITMMFIGYYFAKFFVTLSSESILKIQSVSTFAFSIPQFNCFE